MDDEKKDKPVVIAVVGGGAVSHLIASQLNALKDKGIEIVELDELPTPEVPPLRVLTSDAFPRLKPEDLPVFNVGKLMQGPDFDWYQKFNKKGWKKK